MIPGFQNPVFELPVKEAHAAYGNESSPRIESVQCTPEVFRFEVAFNFLKIRNDAYASRYHVLTSSSREYFPALRHNMDVGLLHSKFVFRLCFTAQQVWRK